MIFSVFRTILPKVSEYFAITKKINPYNNEKNTWVMKKEGGNAELAINFVVVNLISKLNNCT